MALFANNIMTDYLGQQKTRLTGLNIWIEIVDHEEVKNFIINLITEDQLFDKGIDGTGAPLEASDGRTAYSPRTVQIKSTKGGKSGKVSNITLYDTGDYYESHEVKVDNTSFTVDANPIKGDGTNLFEVWGDEIIELTDENMDLLIDFLLEKTVTYTRETIFLLD